MIGLGFSQLLYPLMFAVGLLLLIACANVANLLLTRATVRAREIAVRRALGASRGRLLRQFLIESLCLAVAGCAAGCVLAYVGIEKLVPLIPYNAFPQEAVIELNTPVLLFSLAMAVVCTVCCGISPALQALGRDLRTPLSAGSTTGSRGSSQGRVRPAVGGLALSVVLLVSAGLMMRAFFRMQHVDLGVNTHNILFARLSFPQGVRRKPAEQRAAFQRFFEKVNGMSGITAASITMSRPPFAVGPAEVMIPGKAHSERWLTLIDLCSEGYLETLQQRLLRGRFLSHSDVDSAKRVVVINEAFARQYFANENPIDRVVRFQELDRMPETKDAVFQVIGVVANTKNRSFEQATMPQVYFPYTIMWTGGTTFIARTGVAPESLIPAVRQLVWSVDPNAALIDSTSLDSWLQKYMYANSQFEFIALASFAGIGLLLVLIGIFSVMAYTVVVQTHEIGIRIALGAVRGRIIKIVLRKALALIALGLLIGTLCSLAATRILAHQLQGISFLDPWTYVGVLLLVVVTGLTACLMPAWRAAHVDPVEAIRCE